MRSQTIRHFVYAKGVRRRRGMNLKEKLVWFFWFLVLGFSMGLRIVVLERLFDFPYWFFFFSLFSLVGNLNRSNLYIEPIVGWTRNHGSQNRSCCAFYVPAVGWNLFVQLREMIHGPDSIQTGPSRVWKAISMYYSSILFSSFHPGKVKGKSIPHFCSFFLVVECILSSRFLSSK